MGILEHNVRNWMRETGWKEMREWQWRHDNLEVDIDMEAVNPDEVERAQHYLRAAWRLKKWEDFQNSGRREVEITKDSVYSEERAGLTKEIVRRETIMKSVATGA